MTLGSLRRLGVRAGAVTALLVGWCDLAVPGRAASNVVPTKPNIVFILADDLGGRDLACYGNVVHRTPHLDRLAEQGTRYTQAYSPAPICSAARAAILTGRTPARLQFEFVTKLQTGRQSWNTPWQSPAFTLDLPLAERTVAEVLREDGYSTGFFGKWHVSRHQGGYLNWSHTHGPLQQGFMHGDQEFGSHPYGYEVGQAREFGRFQAGEYPPDALTDRAIEFLRSKRERPFFLYLSHYYVHTPVHSRLRWLYEHYRATLPESQAMYAAMVETLDHLVGRLLGALDELELAENTLVVFTSDNGGHPEYSANGPFRGSKWNLYEGGVRVPFIARWPGRIRPGQTRDEPVIGTDLFPTFCEAAGAPLPVTVALDGRSLVPGWTQRGRASPERALVWHYHPEGEKLFSAAQPAIGINDFKTSQTRPHSAIRVGDFKLLAFADSQRVELYRLSNDVSEQEDLSQSMPEKARELETQLEAYLASVQARRAVPRAD